mmetsp:Transcript_9081/g.13529  ORF Transcript_9081/g.13529 Transcript_9081/m.13529 type:complete len:322 (+) Transcript_9081:342-1307(+)
MTGGNHHMNPSFLATNVATIINRFNSFNPGANIFYTLNGTIIPYVVIWKCVSDGIIKNLYALTTINKNFACIKHEFITSQLQFEYAITAQRFQNSLGSNYIDHQHKKINVFTVVRDPFDRFVSGFTEAVFLTYKHKSFYEKDGKTMKKCTVSDVKSYLHGLLNYELPLILMGHFYPMSGVFFQFNIHTLGHVQSFKSFWEKTIVPMYGINLQFREQLGLHATSVHHPNVAGQESKPHSPSRSNSSSASSSKYDPNNARQELLKLLRTEPRYKRAICHLLLVDYVCLPMYALPPECQFLNRTREAAIAAVSRGQIIPHKIVH